MRMLLLRFLPLRCLRRRTARDAPGQFMVLSPTTQSTCHTHTHNYTRLFQVLCYLLPPPIGILFHGRPPGIYRAQHPSLSSLPLHTPTPQLEHSATALFTPACLSLCCYPNPLCCYCTSILTVYPSAAAYTFPSPSVCCTAPSLRTLGSSSTQVNTTWATHPSGRMAVAYLQSLSASDISPCL